MTEILSSIEAVVTHAEDTWDALESSELAAVIPVAGHIVKIWRAAHNVRDALFADRAMETQIQSHITRCTPSIKVSHCGEFRLFSSDCS